MRKVKRTFSFVFHCLLFMRMGISRASDCFLHGNLLKPHVAYGGGLRKGSVYLACQFCRRLNRCGSLSPGTYILTDGRTVSRFRAGQKGACGAVLTFLPTSFQQIRDCLIIKNTLITAALPANKYTDCFITMRLKIELSTLQES